MITANILKIAGMCIIPILVVVIPVFIGHHSGLYLRKKSIDFSEAPIGTVVAAAFGLLAFMLAFMFQIAANRYENRKQLLLQEVTNIRKTYLQAGLIAEPIRSDTKKLLVDYVDLRVDASKDTSKLNLLLSRSQQILDRIWASAEELAKQDRGSVFYAIFTTTINDLIDNYNHRVTMTFEYRIPTLIYWMLYIIAFLTMLTLGYHFGVSGKGSLGITLVLAVIFAVVMVLIAALDNPEKGMAKLNQKPLLTLQKQLQVMQSAGNNYMLKDTVNSVKKQ